MKKSVMGVMLVLWLMTGPTQAVEPVASRIKEVTLYTNQAMVTREGTATVQQGVNEVLMEVETFRIEPDSVTARIFGQGEILSVQYKERPVVETPQETVRALEIKLKDLNGTRRGLVDKKQTLAKKEAFLEALVDFSQTQMPKDIQTRLPSVAELNETLAFLDTNFDGIYKERQNIDLKLQAVESEIKTLEHELAARRGTAQAILKVIEILFRSDAAGQIRIETRYLARDAGWSPLYKVSVPPGLSGVDLTMFAKIFQKTGENWNQATLSVSNVIPLSGVRLPSLPSWVLDMPRPMARKADRLGATAQGMAPMEATSEKREVVDEAPFARTEVRQLPFSFEYRMPQPVNIESREKETVLPLSTKKLSGEFLHYTVPQQSPLTFIVARVKADGELLAGPLNVYVGGRYLGNTYLDEKQAGEDFDLALGADRDVKVKRIKIRDKMEETTFFGKVERDTVVRELAYKITVENLKSEPIELRLLDSVPISRTDRIEVKQIVFNPTPTEKNHRDQEGVMMWTLKLPSGEKKEVDISFVVSYPRNVSPFGF